jgi:hypothetical protein
MVTLLSQLPLFGGARVSGSAFQNTLCTDLLCVISWPVSQQSFRSRMSKPLLEDVCECVYRPPQLALFPAHVQFAHLKLFSKVSDKRGLHFDRA